MILILSICVTVTFGVSIYLCLGRELKGVAIGVFLLGHAANLSILAMSGSPMIPGGSLARAQVKQPPISSPGFEHALHHGDLPNGLNTMVDPLPQALILTAIVIGFAVMGFLLTLLVMTARATKTLVVNELAKVDSEALPETPTGGGA